MLGVGGVSEVRYREDRSAVMLERARSRERDRGVTGIGRLIVTECWRGEGRGGRRISRIEATSSFTWPVGEEKET